MIVERVQGWRKVLLASCLGLLSACSGDLGLDQHGKPVLDSELKGRWLVVNYWAEWCIPCRTEIPELNELNVQLGHQGQVVGVNFDGLQDEALGKASEALGIRFRVLASDPRAHLDLPVTEMLPATYLVDPQGKLQKRLLGEQSREGILAELLALGMTPP